MPRPLALTDEQLNIIVRASEPLRYLDRGPYLEPVAELLRGREVIGTAWSVALLVKRKPSSCERRCSIARGFRRSGRETKVKPIRQDGPQSRVPDSACARSCCALSCHAVIAVWS